MPEPSRPWLYIGSVFIVFIQQWSSASILYPTSSFANVRLVYHKKVIRVSADKEYKELCVKYMRGFWGVKVWREFFSRVSSCAE